MRVDDPVGGTRGQVRRTGGEVRVSLLDGFALTAGGTARTLPKSARRLVALLALNPRGLLRSAATRRLTPLLETASAQTSLRKALTRLRATRLALIETDGATLRLHPRVTVDVREAEALAARIAANPAGPPEAGPTELLALELLPSWDDAWVDLERTRLLDLFLQALDVHARRLAESGDLHAALAAAHAALRADPLRESTVTVLIEIHRGQRNAGQLVRAYLSYRGRLHAAFGIEPSEALRVLVAPLLIRRPRS